MATMWNALHSAYSFVNYELADPRAQHLPLVTRPFSVLGMLAGYTLFVTRLGPWLMRHREPFQLKNTLVVYNALQVLANLYIFYMGSTQFWLTTYSWRCEPIDRSNSPSALEALRLVNLYFWLKISDLLDTIFFVLRKKESQVTFMHVYHHTIMVHISWIGVKYFPGGHGTFVGTVNTLVHAIMYTYYLFSVLYPHTIWWKKYVSQVQLFQLWIVAIHGLQLLVYNPCRYPLSTFLIALPYLVPFLILFTRYYWRTYCPQAAAQPRAKTS